MATPVEVIFATQDQFKQADELAAAQKQVVDAYVRAYNQIAGHVGELAGLCAKHGKKNLMAGLSDPTRQAIEESLTAMRELYAKCSPFLFPEMPDDPVPVVEPEPVDPVDGLPK
jgi:hypothetical protein